VSRCQCWFNLIGHVHQASHSNSANTYETRHKLVHNYLVYRLLYVKCFELDIAVSFGILLETLARRKSRWQIWKPIRCDLEDQRHSGHGVQINVTMEHPVAWIDCLELEHDVATDWNHYRVLDHRMLNSVEFVRFKLVCPTRMSAKNVWVARDVAVRADDTSGFWIVCRKLLGENGIVMTVKVHRMVPAVL